MRFSAVFLALLFVLLTPAWANDGAGPCGSDCTCATEKAEITLEGRVVPAGPSFYMEGSHLLVDSSGNEIARLSGLKAHLDLSNLEGRWLKIIGRWKPTVEADGKIFEVSGAKTSQEPSSSNP